MLILLAVAGCSVVEAPDNLESLVVFGFVHTTDDDEYVAAFSDGVRPLMAENAAALDIGLKVDALSAADLAAAGVILAGEQDIVGVSAANAYRADVASLAEVLTRPDLENVYEMTVSYEVSWESDRECFLAQTCELYEQQAVRVNDLGFFGTSEQAFTKHFRWGTDSSGDRVLLLRTLSPDPVVVSRDVFQVHQQYDFSLFAPTDTGTLRLENFWIDAQIVGADVPDSFALEHAVKAMKKTRDELDNVIMGPVSEPGDEEPEPEE